MGILLQFQWSHERQQHWIISVYIYIIYVYCIIYHLYYEFNLRDFRLDCDCVCFNPLVHWIPGICSFESGKWLRECLCAAILFSISILSTAQTNRPTDQPSNQAANHRTNDLKKKRADGYGRCDRNLMLIEYSGNWGEETNTQNLYIKVFECNENEDDCFSIF